MRLAELFENVPTRTSAQAMIRPSDRTGRHGRLGAGSYGTVYQDPHNPHDVLKVSNERPHWMKFEDSYLDYLLAIVEDENIQSNSWVPRIRDLRLHRDEDGNVADFAVRLEALHRLSVLGLEEVLSIIDRVFAPQTAKKIHDFIMRFSDKESTAMHVLVEEIRKAILTKENDIFDQVIDEEFIEYIHWHRRALRKVTTTNRSRVHLDIREPNIMVRRGPHGFQPVITDPWA